jgi:DNA-directed RNA polymerase omega subunit
MPVAEGITNPPIDELLTKTDSKYKLVLYAAKRARQINARLTSRRSRSRSLFARSTRTC